MIVFLIGCDKSILDDTIDNSPQDNFQIFWEDFDQHYGLFEARQWDWNSIYADYQPLIDENTSDEELWNYFKEMISYLDDSHTSIYDPAKEIEFESGSEENAAAEEAFSLHTVVDHYLTDWTQLDLVEDEVHLYGRIKDKPIGYVFFSDFEMSETNFFDEILKELEGVEALILDLRNNTGGVDEIAAEIAGRFAIQEELVYTVQTRNGVNHDDFTEKTSYFSSPFGSQNFSKPVILLTDKITVSAAEVFMNYMKSFPQVTQIGDVTAGDFSSIGMRRFLPNGWQYRYSTMMYLLTDGTSLDGVGHIPDITVLNTEEAIQNNSDLVLEEAFSFLFEEYGIE